MKSERSRLVKKLDSIFSKFIRNRDKNICITCGNPASDNGHYIPRARMQFRFDEKNCHAQCKICNWTLESNHDIYRKKMIGLYGESFVELVEADSHKNFHLPTSQIKILITYYTNLMEKRV
jgi:Bacteriophage Lambda NinG protein